MTTLLQFSRNINKIGSRIENNSLELVKRTSKRALRSLVKGTPVKSGKARSNWRVSLGNPTSTVIDPFSPAKDSDISETANANATIAAGISKINQLRVGKARGTGQAGSAVFIANSVPYLDELRKGSSDQQPNDWVKAALLEASEEIKATRLLRR